MKKSNLEELSIEIEQAFNRYKVYFYRDGHSDKIPLELKGVCLMFEQLKEGCSGGSCWGSRASNFYNEDYREEALKEIKSALLRFSKEFEVNKTDSEIALFVESQIHYEDFTYSDGSDYYGNYHENAVFLLSMRATFDFLFEKQPYYKELCEHFYPQLNLLNKEQLKKQKQKELTELNSALSNFEQTSLDEKSRLELEVHQAEGSLLRLKNRLLKFEETAELKKKQLVDKKSQIEAEIKNF